jgi:shikimate dehydrogenase
VTAPAIRGTTRVYAVIGDPVEHSLSPVMQNAAFAACRLDAVYVALRVAPAALPDAVRGFAAARLAGFNVTVPHKEAMLALVDEVLPRARACGAVNTVIRTPRGLLGDSTDGDGFLAALADARLRPRGMRALVIGAGGSARSVADALLRAGAAEVIVLNRTVARAEALAKTLATTLAPSRAARRTPERRGVRTGARVRATRGEKAGCTPAPLRVRAAGLELLRDAATLGHADLIVNCTTTGLAGTELPPIAWARTRPDALCFDLVYGAKPSRFLRHAAAAGRRAVDGRSMLLHQGALAFRLWTGRKAPIEVMRRALTRALR